jgi:hypothetical protein
LKSALLNAVHLSKSAKLAKEALDRARVLSKQAADHAASLSLSAVKLASAAQQIAVSVAKTLGSSAQQFLKTQESKQKDDTAIHAADAAAKIVQRVGSQQIKALQTSMQMRGIAVAAQEVLKNEVAHVAKLDSRRSEALSLARSAALKAKMLSAQARLRVREYNRLLNMLNRKYQAVKDARATALVEVNRYHSALKRLNAARAMFEAASGQKLQPVAAQDDKFKDMPSRIKDALLSTDSVLKMASVAGDVDITLDGVSSAGSQLGSATAETLRAETLKHLLGVTEQASSIRRHALQHMLGVVDLAKKLDTGALGELSENIKK